MADDDTPEVLDHREFMRRFKKRPTSTGPSPWGIGFLIEQVGTGFEFVVAEIQRLESLIMTSAENTDQLIQDATATLVAFETAAQTSLTTLGNDLTAVLADIQAAPNAVQASTLTSLQDAITTLGTLGSSLSGAVGQIDSAVNPAPPASGS